MAAGLLPPKTPGAGGDFQPFEDAAGAMRDTAGDAAPDVFLRAQADGGESLRAHVQNVGWQGWASDGATAGTTGRGLRVEALQIELTGRAATVWDVYYRVHVQDLGWLGWARDGGTSGTTGMSKRVEALQVAIVPKGGSAPGSTARAYVG